MESSNVEAVEEVNPLEMIESLSEDLRIARVALRRIMSVDPASIPGGPNNQFFGLKFVKGLHIAQELASEAYEKMTNQQVGDK